MTKNEIDKMDKEYPALRPPLQGSRKVIPTVTSNPLKAVPATEKQKQISTGSKKSDDPEQDKLDDITKQMKTLQVMRKQIIRNKNRNRKENMIDREGEVETEGEEADGEKSKTKIKVISNVQLVPRLPKDTGGNEEENGAWRTVTGKKRGKMKERKKTRLIKEILSSNMFGNPLEQQL